MTNGLSQPPAGQHGSTSEQAILDHAQKNFSLSANDVSLKVISPENLPAGVEQFYLEKKGSYGNVRYNYLVFNDQVYCSGVPGDFERFLKDSRFLEKKDTDAPRFIKLMMLLTQWPRDMRVINDETMRDWADELKSYREVSLPKMSYSGDGGATVIFYITPLITMRPQQWTVIVAPDYKTTVANKQVPKG